MTQWLRANTAARPLGVDREAKAIRGVIVAEEGPFKSKGRGEFDAKAIREIAKIGNSKPNGLKSILSHPERAKDEILALLGRAVNYTVDTVSRVVDGVKAEVLAARADLMFGDYAFTSPYGNLAEHVMNVVESDGDALGMSLQIDPDVSYRTDRRGRPLMNEAGQPLPPLWYPRDLVGVDVVGDGDATRSMLSASSAPVCVIKEYLGRMYGPEDCTAGRDAATEWLAGIMDELWPLDDEPEQIAEHLNQIAENTGPDGFDVDMLRRRFELKMRAG